MKRKKEPKMIILPPPPPIQIEMPFWNEVITLKTKDDVKKSSEKHLYRAHS